MDNNNNNKKKSHSFYKEQEKSIFGQQQWNAKRIGKLFFKFFKWFIYGFLIIATLWGCVNEFIIQTSNNLGQGVEFYQQDDFVYPNTYQGYNIVGYTATNNMVQQGISSETIFEDEETNTISESVPFDFNVVNPNFNPSITEEDDSYVDGVNYYDLVVKSKDVTSSSGTPMAPIYTYNLNTYTAGLSLNLLSYDWSEGMNITNSVNSTGFNTVMTSVPTKIRESAQEDVDTNISQEDENYYTVSSIDSFIFYLSDKSDSDSLNGHDTNGNDWIEFSEDENGNIGDTMSEFSKTKIGLIPSTDIKTIDDALKIENWNYVEKLNTTSHDSNVAIEAQAKQEVIKQAFLNGTGKESFSDLPEEVQQIYIDANNGNDSDFLNYSVDLTSAAPQDSYVYGGAETFVVPIQKGFPVRISQQSQQLIEDKFREEDFNEWDTSKSENQNEGFDDENQMYGWVLLDASSATKENDYQADLMRVYSTKEAAEEGDVYGGDLSESSFFYADQRRLGWGVEDTNSTINPSTGVGSEEGYSVFDEKIKAWMNQDVGSENSNIYMHKESSAQVNVWNEEEGTYETKGDVDYGYATEFAGMTSIQQVTSTSDEITVSNKGATIPFTGVLPQYGTKANDGQTTYTERSILSDSVIPTGQDSWGESRITFIGMSDWGKAWDVQYGPLYGAFVFPLAQIAMFIGEIFGYAVSAWGTLFSIIVLVFLTRGLGALLSIKGTSNQMKMQEVQTDVAKIKAKYSKYDLKQEPRMKQKQQSEIMALYRKKEINPMGSLGTIFITMPIFISLWIIISALPAYKVVFMGNFSWAVSAWYGIFNLGFGMLILYLMVGVSVGLVQGVSSKVPTWLSNKRKGIKRVDEATKAASKKQNRTQNIMIGVFVFMGLTVPALFAFYWICSGFFTIILELCKHWYKTSVAKRKTQNPQYKTIFEKMSKAK